MFFARFLLIPLVAMALLHLINLAITSNNAEGAGQWEYLVYTFAPLREAVEALILAVGVVAFLWNAYRAYQSRQQE